MEEDVSSVRAWLFSIAELSELEDEWTDQCFLNPFNNENGFPVFVYLKHIMFIDQRENGYVIQIWNPVDDCCYSNEETFISFEDAISEAQKRILNFIAISQILHLLELWQKEGLITKPELTTVISNFS